MLRGSFVVIGAPTSLGHPPRLVRGRDASAPEPKTKGGGSDDHDDDVKARRGAPPDSVAAPPAPAPQSSRPVRNRRRRARATPAAPVAPVAVDARSAQLPPWLQRDVAGRRDLERLAARLETAERRERQWRQLVESKDTHIRNLNSVLAACRCLESCV